MTDLRRYRQSLWPLPPVMESETGKERRVGVEIEFTGLDMDPIADIITNHIGGSVTKKSDFDYRIKDTALGDFVVELDSAYIKRMSQERYEAEESNELEEFAEAIVGLVAKQLVPFEVVSPPIAVSDLWQLEDLFVALRLAGAKGTEASTKNAFGLHLNPEVPSCDATTVRRYIQAFLCLYEWIKVRSNVAISRRITPYIDPFKRDYVKHALAEDYQPDMDQLIDDYIRFNPTRNRALDMLPLFAHIDEPRLRAKIDDPRVNARPTLHYRLPNSQIDNTQWALVHAWRDYLQVDALANDPDRLEQVRKAYCSYLDKTSNLLFGDWPEDVSRWLLPELL